MRRGGCHGKHTFPVEYLSKQMRNSKAHKIKSLLLPWNNGEESAWYFIPSQNRKLLTAPELNTEDGTWPEALAEIPRCAK